MKNDKDEDRFKAEIIKSWRAFLAEQPFGNLDDWTNYYGGEDKMALISREESREIIKTLSLKPFESKYKVMIIWQPELMHPSAANGILKILEEPPPHTYFILITNAADKLLPTIISRTQIVTVPLLSDEVVESVLREKYNVEENRAAKIAQLADGNLNLALKLTEKEEDNNTQRFIDWMRACFKRNYGYMVNLADEYHGLDKLSQRNMLAYSISMIRETLLHISGANTINRTRGDELKFVQDFSKVMTIDKAEKSFYPAKRCHLPPGTEWQREDDLSRPFLEVIEDIESITKPFPMNKIIRIGTRASKLALWQAEYVASLIKPSGYQTEIVPMETKGR